MREFFSHKRPRKKRLLHFLHSFLRNVKNIVALGELMHLWSDLDKIKFYPILVGQMNFLMSQMITRNKYFSNELSWAQFGFEEDFQKLTTTTLFL